MTLNRWIAIGTAFALLASPALSLADHHAAGEDAAENRGGKAREEADERRGGMAREEADERRGERTGGKAAERRGEEAGEEAAEHRIEEHRRARRKSQRIHRPYCSPRSRRRKPGIRGKECRGDRWPRRRLRRRAFA